MKYFFIKAKNHDITVSYVNPKLIKVQCNKFKIDSWLIKENEDGDYELWHRDKSDKICNYHKQKYFKRKNKRKIFKTILQHNNFVLKKRKSVDWVDELLKNNRQQCKGEII